MKGRLHLKPLASWTSVGWEEVLLALNGQTWVWLPVQLLVREVSLSKNNLV